MFRVFKEWMDARRRVRQEIAALEERVIDIAADLHRLERRRGC